MDTERQRGVYIYMDDVDRGMVVDGSSMKEG